MVVGYGPRCIMLKQPKKKRSRGFIGISGCLPGTFFSLRHLQFVVESGGLEGW